MNPEHTPGKDAPRCINCGEPIYPPQEGSYPPSVRWVHGRNDMGVGNRYCYRNGTGYTARPRSKRG